LTKVFKAPSRVPRHVAMNGMKRLTPDRIKELETKAELPPADLLYMLISRLQTIARHRLPIIAASALVGITAECLNLPLATCILLVVAVQACLLGLTLIP
jgi:hypothetical protein